MWQRKLFSPVIIIEEIKTSKDGSTVHGSTAIGIESFHRQLNKTLPSHDVVYAIVYISLPSPDYVVYARKLPANKTTTRKNTPFSEYQTTLPIKRFILCLPAKNLKILAFPRLILTPSVSPMFYTKSHRNCD